MLLDKLNELARQENLKSKYFLRLVFLSECSDGVEVSIVKSERVINFLSLTDICNFLDCCFLKEVIELLKKTGKNLSKVVVEEVNVGKILDSQSFLFDLCYEN